MNGKDIAELIYGWATKNGIHPDDFDALFVHELLDELEADGE